MVDTPEMELKKIVAHVAAATVAATCRQSASIVEIAARMNRAPRAWIQTATAGKVTAILALRTTQRRSALQGIVSGAGKAAAGGTPSLHNAVAVPHLMIRI